MNTIDFCFWLQGYFELSNDAGMSEAQIKTVREHLNLVFLHEIDQLRESQTTTIPSVLNSTHSPDNDKLVRC